MAKKDNQNDTTTGSSSGSASSATGSSKGSGAESRTRAADAYQSARTRTRDAYAGTRDKVSGYGRKAADQVSANPVGAVAGGFAVGALIAAVLPRTEKEQRYLGTAGRKLTDAARGAANNAIEQSRDKIDQATGSVVNKLGAAVLETVGQKD